MDDRDVRQHEKTGLFYSEVLPVSRVAGALAIPQAKLALAISSCEVIRQCQELVPEHPRTHDYTRLINSRTLLLG